MGVEFKEYPFDERPAGTEKIARRRSVEDSGELLSNRFFVPENTESALKIKQLEDLAETLEKECPSFIAIALHGSVVKGYANSNSDIDGYILLDETKLKTELSEKRPGNFTISLQALHQIDGIVRSKFGGKDLSTLGKTLTSKDYIKSEIDQHPEMLYIFFLYAIGDKINEIRKYILDNLRHLEDGEKKWQVMVEALWQFENVGFNKEFAEKRKSLYPWILEEAERTYKL